MLSIMERDFAISLIHNTHLKSIYINVYNFLY